MSDPWAVVGGGAIGLSIAWELSERGRRVTVIDAGDFGSGTTSAATGILPPASFSGATDSIDRLRGFSHQRFPQWATRLLEVTGIDVELRSCGGWYLADGPGEAAALMAMKSYWDEMGIESSPATMEQFRQREPAVRGPLVDSMTRVLWAPNEYRIDPRAYARALREACQQSDVTLMPSTSVLSVDDQRTHANVQTQHERYRFERVILCGGPQLGQLASAYRLGQSIIPIRGQVLRFQLRPGMLQSVINVGNRYLVHRDDGTVLVGSCEEEAGFDRRTTPEVLESLTHFAKSLVPEIGDARLVESWAGLRPMTFDGFPMIGRVPESETIYVAGGHYRSGIHLSPGTAVAMADLLLGQTPAVNLDDFRVMKQQSIMPG